MKKLVLILPVLLMACGPNKDTGIAPGIQIPPLPEKLAEKAKSLPANDDNTMGGQVKDNTRNIREYNARAFQVNDLIALYNCVREAVNNKKEIKCQ